MRIFYAIPFLLLLSTCGSTQSASSRQSLPSSCDSLRHSLATVASPTEFTSYYAQATETLLISQRDTTGYQQLRACYLLLTDREMIDLAAIDFTHHYQLGRYGLITKVPALTAAHLDSAFQLRPTHKPLREMLADFTFTRAQVFMAANDLPALGTFLRQSAATYPFLLEDEKFRELLVFTSTQPD